MERCRMPERLFEEVVPLPFLQDTVRMLFGCYRGADDECKYPMPWQVAHDYRGHRRRRLIEEQWPAVALKYADHGLRATYESNTAGTSYYTKICCGPIVLTESYVETPEKIVRHAAFRETLAESNQPSLFEEENEPPPPTNPLFALLIHGEDHKKRHPYFADIVFPSTKGVYLARISLFSLCHALVNELIGPVQEEVIPDEAMPKLRAEENRDA